MLFVATLFVVTLDVTAFPSKRGETNKSNEFLNNLRRQLTRDNYDYSGDEQNYSKKEKLHVMRANYKLDELQVREKNTSAQRDSETGTNTEKLKPFTHKQVTRVNFYVPGLNKVFKEPVKRATLEVKKSRKVEYTVSNRDLLYYIDDRELVSIPEKNNYTIQEGIERYVTKAQPKYKTLKLKHQYRRKNQPRLIQEERIGTVAIVNLDQGPIPEVSLPQSRRQYMRDRGEIVGDEEEILPPPVNSNEPEAAPAEEYTNVTMFTTNDLTGA